MLGLISRVGLIFGKQIPLYGRTSFPPTFSGLRVFRDEMVHLWRFTGCEEGREKRAGVRQSPGQSHRTGCSCAHQPLPEAQPKGELLITCTFCLLPKAEQPLSGAHSTKPGSRELWDYSLLQKRRAMHLLCLKKWISRLPGDEVRNMCQ